MVASNALTLMDRRDLTPNEAHAAYIESKREVIVNTFIPEAFRKNGALIDMFLELSKSRMLNPFAKQIYCIPRGGGASIEVSIDGYRLIASRSGEYGGRDEYLYDREDGKQPGRATCTVYRIVRGVRCPFTATVRWDEFGAAGAAARYENLWKSKPYHMLGITAERHALKAAFPEEMMAVDAANGELGGYEDDGDVPPPREVRAPSTPIQPPARVAPLSAPRIKATAQPNGPEEQRRRFAEMAQERGLPIHEGMTSEEMAAVIDVGLTAAGLGFRVLRTDEGTVTARALHNALMAIQPRQYDTETGEVLDGEAREAPEMSEDDRALWDATDAGRTLPLVKD
jgi:phage recombination protein Bet